MKRYWKMIIALFCYDYSDWNFLYKMLAWLKKQI